MGAASDYLENKVLDHVFKTAEYTPPTHIYVALCKSTIDDTHTGSTLPGEVTGGGYARAVCDDWAPAVGGYIDNENIVNFSRATADWGIVSNIALCDAETGGNVLVYGRLYDYKEVVTGDEMVFEAGELNIDIDAAAVGTPVYVHGWSRGTTSVTAATAESYITAASPALADVQAAIAAASAGDTVIVPAGSATWTNQLVITKGVLVQAETDGGVTITSGYEGGYGFDNSNFLVAYVPSAPEDNDPFRLSGFIWNVENKSGWLKIYNSSTTNIPNKIRIDNNQVNDTTQMLFLLHGHAYGSMDNNDFNGGIFRFLGSDASAWTNLSFSYGGANNWYIEDNTIEALSSFSMPVYAEGGARYCVRHNTIEVSADSFPLFDAHGNGPSTSHHATMGIEIYENEITAGTYQGNLMELRGGAGLVFNNNVTASGSWYGVNMREEYADSENPPATGPTGQPQHVKDVYLWSNTKGGSSNLAAYIGTTLDYGGEVGVVPRADVHFWDYDASFDGSSGVGVGLLSARPVSCSLTGAGYWATDTETLYRWTGAAWETYYTPYTYPHPHRSDADLGD